MTNVTHGLRQRLLMPAQLAAAVASAAGERGRSYPGDEQLAQLVAKVGPRPGG